MKEKNMEEDPEGGHDTHRSSLAGTERSMNNMKDIHSIKKV